MSTRAITVVAVTQSDPFFTGRFFEAFLRESMRLPVQLVEIVLLRNFNESKPALAWRLWKLYGSLDMARLFGRYASARIADRFGIPRSVEAIATRHGIPVRRLTTINDPAYLRSLGERGVDVLLSVASPEIFRPAALKAAPYVLNVHCGKLPTYRGMMPTFWALHDGEKQIVVTVHEMVEALDAGGVLAEYPVPVAPADSAFDLAARAKLLAGREVARLLGRLHTPTWPQPHPVDMARQRYFRFPARRHARELRASGRRML
jgi:folate-dependent phosphoribosylglycinamide formyltransferase PurN